MRCPSSGKNYPLTLRQRKLLVQGLTDSLTMFGTEIPGEMSSDEIKDSEARKLELRKLRDTLATPRQRKEFGKP